MKEDRIKKLEYLLLNGPYHRSVLAQQLNCSIDSVRRDITKLLKLGSDVNYTDSGWCATVAVFSENLS